MSSTRGSEIVRDGIVPPTDKVDPWRCREIVIFFDLYGPARWNFNLHVLKRNVTMATAHVKPAGVFASWLMALYSVSLLSGVSLGLFSILISAFMEEAGVDSMWIGANATIYFFFLGLGAPLIERAVRCYGTRSVMVAGLLLTATVTPLFPLTHGLVVWFVVRALMGLGVCCYTVAAQIALNHFAPTEHRATVTGAYAFAFAVGLALGPVLGPSIYAISPQLAFIIGAGVVMSGVGVVLWAVPSMSVTSSPRRVSVLRKITLPLHGVFAYGFAEASLFALYSVFLLRQGYDVQQMGLAFSSFVVGSLISTLPVTRLGDHWGKEPVLHGCVCVGVLSVLGLGLVEDFLLTLTLSFIAGGSLGPVYALTLAIIGGALSSKELPSGSAWFTASFSLGATVGPLLTALTMRFCGDQYIFTLTIIVFGLLIINFWFSHKKNFY
jgi:MFS family permease